LAAIQAVAYPLHRQMPQLTQVPTLALMAQPAASTSQQRMPQPNFTVPIAATVMPFVAASLILRQSVTDASAMVKAQDGSASKLTIILIF
jgi:hypothetical protein